MSELPAHVAPQNDKTAHSRAELAFARRRKIAPSESQTKVDATPRADEERRAMLRKHAASRQVCRGMSGDPAGPVDRTSATDTQDYGSILARQFPFVQFSRNPCRTNSRCGMWEMTVQAASLLTLRKCCGFDFVADNQRFPVNKNERV
ncbi:hypothetical protein [Paraburkholderia sp. 2C]